MRFENISILCLDKPEKHQTRTSKYRLENDDICGITTGGKENCEWDCIPSSSFSFYKNPECLIDCFDEDHCAVKAINDYRAANGICRGNSFVLDNNELPTSTLQCEYESFINDNDFPLNVTLTKRGIFNEDTLQLLKDNETCIYDVYQKSEFMIYTMQILIFTSSDLRVFQNWYYFAAKFIFGFPAISSFLPFPNDRLHPGLR